MQQLRNILILLSLTCCQLKANETLKSLNQAKSYLPPNLDNMVQNLDIGALVPVKDSPAFLYRYITDEGILQYVIINPETKAQKPLFNIEKLSAALKKINNLDFNQKYPPIGRVRTDKELKFFKFDFTNLQTKEVKRYQCEFDTYQVKECEKAPKPQPPAPLWAEGQEGYRSPDNKWEIFEKDFNLALRNLETKEVKMLTSDATELTGYGLTNVHPNDMFKQKKEDIRWWPWGKWSPDSRFFATYKIDFSANLQTSFTNSASPNHLSNESYSSFYIYGGDSKAPVFEQIVFDLKTGKKIKIDHPARNFLGYGAYFHPTWSEDSKGYYFFDQPRSRKAFKYSFADISTGKTRDIIREDAGNDTITYGYGMDFPKILTKTYEAVWPSERDGWAHLYLYDTKTGKLKNQITSGKWVVRKIKHIDEENRVIFFMACGITPEFDPYYQQLCRVNFDGTGLKILTPENAQHAIKFYDNHRYFTDRYSRTDLPGSTVFRDIHGNLLFNLAKVNDARLIKERGYIYPERFVAKGRDGKTDIYGTVFRPAKFDPNKKYPIIEFIYPGPHNTQASTTFDCYFWRESVLSQLGFIVVQIDAMGSNFRGRAFRHVSYKNLADAGIADRRLWLKALTEKYPYADISRVGIFGHSAGGYASTRCILDAPDLYKACVSSAGNHDHRLDKATWVETWMSYPDTDHYHDQSNITDAHKLQGHLLLMHGELDDNVPVAATLRLADALNKAQKNYRLMIAPNMKHALDEYYWYRGLWPFFMRHLKGEELPAQFKLGDKVEWPY